MRLNEFLDDAAGDVLVCGCGCGFGSRIQHWGGPSPLLADIHGAIRRTVDVPVYVLSGARCPRHNAAVAITERSQHSIARALDLACPQGWKLSDFLPVCIEAVNRMTSGQGGVGYYPAQNFVHIDVGDGEVAGRRWTT